MSLADERSPDLAAVPDHTPSARPARRARAVPPPDPALVQRLRGSTGYPSVSILMSTRPGPSMSGEDRVRLRALLREAGARLAAEGEGDTGGRASHDELLGRLTGLADAAVAEPTGDALALFVGPRTAERLALPVRVVDRVVVDPTFATRDLVRAMHRTPRHAVLVLTEREARLYESTGGTLGVAPGHRFPLRATAGTAPRGRHPDRPRLRQAEVSAFLRTVDRALGAHLAARPTPLILVGPARLVGAFRRVSGNLSRLAGTLAGNLSRLGTDELALRLRPMLEHYLRSREAEAMALLDRRLGENRAVTGLAAAWLAARRERPELLVVEEGLFVPVRLTPDGDHLIPASDVEHPDVVDDLVDELIETVLNRGGWVALVADGALAAHDGVALTVRRG